MSSSNDISDSCETLKRLAPVSQCGDGLVNGTFVCLSNNENIDKDYCAENSDPINTGVRIKARIGMLGLVSASVSVLFL